MSDIPEDLVYTSEHEWMRIDGNKAEIGITNHAQNELGDIVYVELPILDDEIDSGEEFGTIESVKAVSPLYMPVSGRIIEVNSELQEHPELVNEDCYDEGWLVRIEITNAEDTDELLDPEAYKAIL
ncbi:MAG: glycine cleavage system protein GcvH [SAR324 cluster bacterium]|jgi:glycine cleavage system H protein|nr:glycine cleavage system protein H [Deltaproteobacteria bacterium]MAD99747.1 glycine cleavage system protein H [Pseudomonadota bacterium]MDP6092039.1 glycine cleavage system protein GcvH [SAR324 cluster bacterium]MBI12331.1 glycine cleavage system protein H [Deltaproteobacteria bacterium]MBP44546.1 glycine cleavage system protein H [Deltaproteobacteria bacterium]|tara:strand:+ start:272 stop:649 length:378 start_codon:yes stop_codon:yes gene_type:complete